MWHCTNIEPTFAQKHSIATTSLVTNNKSKLWCRIFSDKCVCFQVYCIVMHTHTCFTILIVQAFNSHISFCKVQQCKWFTPFYKMMSRLTQCCVFEVSSSRQCVNTMCANNSDSHYQLWCCYHGDALYQDKEDRIRVSFVTIHHHIINFWSCLRVEFSFLAVRIKGLSKRWLCGWCQLLRFHNYWHYHC